MSDYQRYGWLMALLYADTGHGNILYYFTHGWIWVVILYYIILYEPLPNNI